MLENSVIDREKIIILALLTGFIVFSFEYSLFERVEDEVSDNFLDKPGDKYAVNFDNVSCYYIGRLEEDEEITEGFELVSYTEARSPADGCYDLMDIADSKNYFEEHLERAESADGCYDLMDIADSKNYFEEHLERAESEEEVQLLNEGLEASESLKLDDANRLRDKHKEDYTEFENNTFNVPNTSRMIDYSIKFGILIFSILISRKSFSLYVRYKTETLFDSLVSNLDNFHDPNPELRDLLDVYKNLLEGKNLVAYIKYRDLRSRL